MNTTKSVGDAENGAGSRPPTAATRLAVLLGDPVRHSLSPLIHNAALDHAGIDAVYVALRCGRGRLAGLLYGIAEAGGVGNVTVPHKLAAAGELEHATGSVARTGACNTFWEEDGALVGDNTDVAGFRAALGYLQRSAAGSRVLVLGAGGAARAVLCGLADERVDRVVLYNRTPSRAEELARTPAAAGVTVRVETDRASLRRERFDIVVNATTLGLAAEDPLPLPPEEVGGMTAALDLVYTPGRTQWVRALRGAGIEALDGREMLLHQAAASFERWWKREAPIRQMRAALEGSE